MLKIAQQPRLGRTDAKLLVINQQEINHQKLSDLPSIIPSNSLLVINDAATLPGSIRGLVRSFEIEIRLVKNKDPTLQTADEWQVLVFHDGSWRDRTEDRLSPDFLEIGDIITIGSNQAEIITIDHPSKRLVSIRFTNIDQSSIWNLLYQYGKPIQYSHLEDELELWDVQTIFASRPVAVEPPSASFQFTWALIDNLIAKGVTVVAITHATSISSTGLQDLDSLLPFDERYYIDESAAEIINKFHTEGRPIFALGTSVTRALEANVQKFSKITHGSYTSNLVINASYQRKIVTGLITGMHLPEESHMQLLLNFVDENILEFAYNEAKSLEYLWHEYGDLNVIL